VGGGSVSGWWRLVAVGKLRRMVAWPVGGRVEGMRWAAALGEETAARELWHQHNSMQAA